MAGEMMRWYYHFPGCTYAYGPTTKRYATEKVARKGIREVWDLKKLPNGTEVWPVSDRDVMLCPGRQL